MFCNGGMSNKSSPKRPRIIGFCWLIYVSRFTWIRLRKSFTRVGSERDLLSRKRVYSVNTNRWQWWSKTNRCRRRRSLWDRHTLSRRVESLARGERFHRVFDQLHASNRRPGEFVGLHSDCPGPNNHHSLMNDRQRLGQGFHPYGRAAERSRATERRIRSARSTCGRFTLSLSDNSTKLFKSLAHSIRLRSW